MASLWSHVEERRVRFDIWPLVQPCECLLSTALSTASEESYLFPFEKIPEDGDVSVVRYIGIVSVVVLRRLFEILLASDVLICQDSVDVADDYCGFRRRNYLYPRALRTRSFVVIISLVRGMWLFHLRWNFTIVRRLCLWFVILFRKISKYQFYSLLVADYYAWDSLDVSLERLDHLDLLILEFHIDYSHWHSIKLENILRLERSTKWRSLSIPVRYHSRLTRIVELAITGEVSLLIGEDLLSALLCSMETLLVRISEEEHIVLQYDSTRGDVEVVGRLLFCEEFSQRDWIVSWLELYNHNSYWINFRISCRALISSRSCWELFWGCSVCRIESRVRATI